MARFYISYALGPAMVGLALIFLVHNADRLTTLLTAVGGLALTLYTQHAGHRWLLSKVRPGAHILMRWFRLPDLMCGGAIFANCWSFGRSQ